MAEHEIQSGGQLGELHPRGASSRQDSQHNGVLESWKIDTDLFILAVKYMGTDEYDKLPPMIKLTLKTLCELTNAFASAMSDSSTNNDTSVSKEDPKMQELPRSMAQASEAREQMNIGDSNQEDACHPLVSPKPDLAHDDETYNSKNQACPTSLQNENAQTLATEQKREIRCLTYSFLFNMKIIMEYLAKIHICQQNETPLLDKLCNLIQANSIECTKTLKRSWHTAFVQPVLDTAEKKKQFEELTAIINATYA